MFQLTEQDQRFLLRIARDSVQSHLLNEPPRLPEVPAGILTEPRGVFVSIHKHGALRGCIGNIHPVGALYQTAAECAVAAAVGDPRFMPLMLAELPEVEFEVSVLSPIERVENIADIADYIRERNPAVSQRVRAVGAGHAAWYRGPGREGAALPISGSTGGRS